MKRGSGGPTPAGTGRTAGHECRGGGGAGERTVHRGSTQRGGGLVVRLAVGGRRVQQGVHAGGLLHPLRWPGGGEGGACRFGPATHPHGRGWLKPLGKPAASSPVGTDVWLCGCVLAYVHRNPQGFVNSSGGGWVSGPHSPFQHTECAGRGGEVGRTPPASKPQGAWINFFGWSKNLIYF